MGNNFNVFFSNITSDIRGELPQVESGFYGDGSISSMHGIQFIVYRGSMVIFQLSDGVSCPYLINLKK